MTERGFNWGTVLHGEEAARPRPLSQKLLRIAPYPTEGTT
jgi:hypothetical protein